MAYYFCLVVCCLFVCCLSTPLGTLELLDYLIFWHFVGQKRLFLGHILFYFLYFFSDFCAKTCLFWRNNLSANQIAWFWNCNISWIARRIYPIFPAYQGSRSGKMCIATKSNDSSFWATGWNFKIQAKRLILSHFWPFMGRNDPKWSLVKKLFVRFLRKMNGFYRRYRGP